MLIVIFREIEYNEGKCVVSILPATYYAYCGSENKPRQKREIKSCFYFPQCNIASMKVPYEHFLFVERQLYSNQVKPNFLKLFWIREDIYEKKELF